MKKEKEYIHSICPLCGENDAVELNTFNSKIVFNRLPHPKKISFSNFDTYLKKLWQSEKCTFLECQNCRLCYSKPFIQGDFFYYNLLYSDEVEYPKWKWDFQISYDFLKHIKVAEKLVNMRILEIGAGNGAFIKKIAPGLTQKENVLTTEYSVYGREEIENYGIKCEGKDILELEVEKKKDSFDVICMFQVLEHMSNLDKIFNQISKLIKKGGSLLITVPNNKHREIFEQFGYIEDIPPTHVSRWNSNSFTFLSKLYNWEIVEHKIQPTDLFFNIDKYMIHCNKRKMFYKSNKIDIVTIKKLAEKDLGISQWICLKKQ